MSDTEKINFSRINCEEKLNAFIKEKYPDATKNGHTRLMQDMAVYFKKSTDPTHKEIKATNIADIIKSNFNNGIKGKKSLPIHLVLAIERVTGKSFYNILFGEETEESEDDIERFLITAEYAAYKDDPIIYRRLIEKREQNGCNHTLFASDEFNHTLLDYIIENYKKYKTGINGLRFFIEENKLTPTILNYDHDESPANTQAVWQMLLDEDAPELFLKFAAPDTELESQLKYSVSNEAYHELLNSIFKTKNIYARLLQPFERENGIPYFSQIAFSLLQFAIKNDNSAEIKRIVNAYKKYVDEMINKEIKGRSSVTTNYRSHSQNGYTTIERFTDKHQMGTPLFELWEMDEYCGPYEELTKLLPDHEFWALFNRLQNKTVDDLKDGEFLTDAFSNVTYYKYNKPPFWIRLYLEGTKLGKDNPFPRCIKFDNDIYSIDLLDEFNVGGDFIEYMSLLGKAHNICSQLLGNGNVYAPPYLEYLYREISQTNHIDHWDQAHETTAIASVTDSLLNHKSFRYSTRPTFEDIKKAVIAYARPEVTENFGDKFYTELDNRINDYVKNKHGYVDTEYDTLNQALGIARLYREEFNNLSTTAD